MRLTRTTRTLALAGLALLAGARSAAADGALDQAFSPRALGMGGALRGAATGSAAPMNPAGIALVRAYALEGSYGYRGTDNATLITASVADSVTSRLGMALYYHYMASSAELEVAGAGTPVTMTHEQTRHEVGGAMAFPLSERFMLGVTPKYAGYESKMKNPVTGDETSSSDKDRFNLDVGAVIGLTPSITLGLVGYNLVYHDVAYPRALAAGLALGLGKSALFGADVVVDMTTTDDAKLAGSAQSARMSAGAELLLAGMYPLRAGGVYDTRDEDVYVSGGVGYLSPRVGLDVGFRQQVRGGSETMVVVGLKLLLPTEEQVGASSGY